MFCLKHLDQAFVAAMLWLMESDFWIIPVPLEVKHIAYKYNSGQHIDGSIQVNRRRRADTVTACCTTWIISGQPSSIVARLCIWGRISGYQIWVWNPSGYESYLGMKAILPAQCAYSFLWSIHILHAQYRGVKPPCAILFGNDLRVGLHIFVLSILKLQNAKDEKS